VSGMITAYGLEPIGMFELSPVGIPIAIGGLVYLYLARRFVPDRQPPAELAEGLGIKPYLSELVILPESRLAGKTLRDANIGPELGLEVQRIIRGERRLAPRSSTVLQAGDILVTIGTEEDILRIKDTAGVEIVADAKLSDDDVTDDATLAEAVLLPGSPLIGRTLRRQRFRERYGLQVLGINHHGRKVVDKLDESLLHLGDVLLVQGRLGNIERLHENNVFRVLRPVETIEDRRPRRGRAPLAIAIFVVVLALVTFGVLPLPLAVMLGAFAAFVTRCITPAEAYGAIEWRVIILIGSMLSLGVAMEHTGAANFLAARLLSFAGADEPRLLLTVFFVLTVLLTQPMSNQAAAIVVLPLGLETAVQSGLDPRTFAMMIAVAASCSYLTPLEPACLMVYGPGRYRFADFLKIGALLTVLIYAIAVALVPVVWPPK